MSKDSKRKKHGHAHGHAHADDAQREERRRAQYEARQQRAAAAPFPAAHREHVEGVDLEGREEYYYPLLHAIEAALVAVFEQRDRLLVDEDAERALRLLIARVEGDAGRHSGSADVDALADTVRRNLDMLGTRFTPAEVVGALRRIIRSIGTWHTLEDPRSYFDFVSGYVVPGTALEEPPAAMPAATSPIWTPGHGSSSPREETPRRPGGIILPGEY